MFNRIFKRYLLNRFKRIENIRAAPIAIQDRTFRYLLSRAEKTEIGKQYQFDSILSHSEYSKRLPLVEYQDIYSKIERIVMGEKDVFWPGKVKWFAKSSGTTNNKSKYIPVTSEKLYQSHIASSWDVMSILYDQRPDSQVFAEKSLVMGGSLEKFKQNPSAINGDVSAIMIKNMPAVGRPFYTPDFKTALLKDWEEKLEIMSLQCANQNVVLIGGVPTWTIILIRKILERTGKTNLLEVWPNLKTYVHGGVGFEPYQEQFAEFLPSDQIDYLEVYNASEGYFGIQDDFNRDDLLLLLDHGIYYEFIPMEFWDNEEKEAIPLSDVELNKNYAIVISSVAGLWRYMPGDTVKFTDLSPFRIKVTGRTKHFINAFGEELMISNTDQAIAQTCEQTKVIVTEYTVAPIYFSNHNQAGHQWLVEFEKEPGNLEFFSKQLDDNLQKINSDYEAKRYKDIALGPLKIVNLPEGSFLRWMKQRGKIGGQNKIPRLSNDRVYVDSILEFINGIQERAIKNDG